jgi:hypothetical protein
LPDDFLGCGMGDEMGEPFQGDGVAVVNMGRHRLLQGTKNRATHAITFGVEVSLPHGFAVRQWRDKQSFRTERE